MRGCGNGPDLRVGFILSPEFTLLAFSSFVDTIRHAADQGDRSRQIHCRWTIVGSTKEPVRSSCGASIAPWQTYDDAPEFDYVVVVGGRLEGLSLHAEQTFEFIRGQAAKGVGIVSLCTGVFALGRAGILDGRTCCLHEEYVEAFRKQFPAARSVLGRSFIEESGVITCIGGVAPIRLALMLVERHCGMNRAAKAAYGLCTAEVREQADVPVFAAEQHRSCGNRHLQRALKFMSADLKRSRGVGNLASAVGISQRQLTHIFSNITGMSPRAYWRQLSLEHARTLILESPFSLTEIALRSGFSDASHFTMQFRRLYGETPGSVRKVQASMVIRRRIKSSQAPTHRVAARS